MKVVLRRVRRIVNCSFLPVYLVGLVERKVVQIVLLTLVRFLHVELVLQISLPITKFSTTCTTNFSMLLHVQLVLRISLPIVKSHPL